MKRADRPLEVKIERDRLVISIGVKCLAFAIEWAPGLEKYDEKTGDFLGPKITDPLVFAKEIERQLSQEEEDGTTMVHRMIDKAAAEALEQGAEGVALPGE